MPEARNVVGYARVLGGQLQGISKFYISNPKLDQAFTLNPKGFILIGLPGSGKTTLLQRIVSEEARKAIQDPRRSLVPILIPMRRWQQDGILENLKATVRSYYPMSERVFNQLLKKNRFLYVFDGLDELRYLDELRANWY